MEGPVGITAAWATLEPFIKYTHYKPSKDFCFLLTDKGEFKGFLAAKTQDQNCALVFY